MQRSSRVGLFVSASFFFSAGTVHFWPEEGFAPPEPERVAFRPHGMPLMIPEAMSPGGMLRGPFSYGPGDGDPFAVGPGRFIPREALLSAMPFPTPRLHVDYTNTPTKDALVNLFRRASLAYSIDPGVKGRVSLRLDNAPVGLILKQMQINSNPPFICRVEQGRYVVRPVSNTAVKTTRPAQASSSALASAGATSLLSDMQPHLKSARK